MTWQPIQFHTLAIIMYNLLSNPVSMQLSSNFLIIKPHVFTTLGNQIVLAATTQAFNKSPVPGSSIVTTKIARKILPLPATQSPISSTTSSPQPGSSLLTPQLYATQLKRPLAATVTASDSNLSSSQESSILEVCLRLIAKITALTFTLFSCSYYTYLPIIKLSISALLFNYMYV